MISISQTDDLEACHQLRRTVFIEEQGVSEADELDDLDADAIHLIALDGTRPLGTVRLILKGETGKIGRLCVLAGARGAGLGAALVKDACMRLRAQGCTRACLSAQDYAIPFYQKLGFNAYGELYDDAGIPHRDMEKPL